VQEFARVLARKGLGFTSFLELLRIPTVRDFPGPEHHARNGYDYRSLAGLVKANGLQIEGFAYCLRLFTKLMADLVGFIHIVYERIVLRKRAWTWFDVTRLRNTRALGPYALSFSALPIICRLDRAIQWMPGFGLRVALINASG
jgi:hypothetical protein